MDRSTAIQVKGLALILALAISAPLPAARAQDDQAYCRQLSELYRRYVQPQLGRRVDVEALLALDQCGTSKAAEAIPVLEKKLRAARVTPPGGGEFRP